jgi:hypothetical protein
MIRNRPRLAIGVEKVHRQLFGGWYTQTLRPTIKLVCEL